MGRTVGMARRVVSPAVAAALLALACASVATAQDQELSGRIVDRRTGTGVAGATVMVAGMPGTASEPTDPRTLRRRLRPS